MALENKFVGLADASYEQIESSLKTTLATLIPELTDTSENEPAYILASVAAGLQEQMLVYANNQAQETFIEYATQLKSMLSLANAVGYSVKGLLPAYCQITLNVAAPVSGNKTVFNGTGVSSIIFQTETGIKFRPITPIIILNGQTSATFTAMQVTDYIEEEGIGVGTGESNLTLALPEKATFTGLVVTVDSEIYSHFTTDSLLNVQGERYLYYQQINPITLLQEIRFGDGIDTNLIADGVEVTVNYFTTEGSSGNVAANEITSYTGLPVISGVTYTTVSNLKAYGGREAETVDELRVAIKALNQLNNRIVTASDYEKAAMLTDPCRNAKADWQEGQPIKVYAYGYGGEITSPTLLQEIADYLEPRRILGGPRLSVVAAGESLIAISMDVKVLASYRNPTFAQQLVDLVKAFSDRNTAKIKDEIRIGNLYQLIENITGVQYAKITRVTVLPTVKPLGVYTAISLTYTQKEGVFAGVLIKLVFTSGTNFILYKNGVFVNNYTVGIAVELPEITFTVVNNGVGASGRSYEFYAYPVSNDIVLLNYNVPIIETVDITLL